MTEVTRAEFDMLHDIVKTNASRLDTIDQSGTRGVGVVQQQITELTKDVTALSVRLEQHEKDHKSEADRQQARQTAASRWRWTTVIAASASMAAVLGLLVEIAQHVR